MWIKNADSDQEPQNPSDPCLDTATAFAIPVAALSITRSLLAKRKQVLCDRWTVRPHRIPTSAFPHSRKRLGPQNEWDSRETILNFPPSLDSVSEAFRFAARIVRPPTFSAAPRTISPFAKVADSHWRTPKLWPAESHNPWPKKPPPSISFRKELSEGEP